VPPTDPGAADPERLADAGPAEPPAGGAGPTPTRPLDAGPAPPVGRGGGRGRPAEAVLGAPPAGRGGAGPAHRHARAPPLGPAGPWAAAGTARGSLAPAHRREGALVARWAATAPVGPGGRAPARLPQGAWVARPVAGAPGRGGRVAGYGSVRTRAARPVEAPPGAAVEAGTPTAAGPAPTRRWSPPHPPTIRRGLQATPRDLPEDHPVARGHRRRTLPVHPAAGREPRGRGNPPSGAPAGGRRRRRTRRCSPRRRPAAGPVRRGIPQGYPAGAPGAGRRGCPWQAGPWGPPDVTPSVESNRALGLERCPGLEQRLDQEPSTGAPELQGAPELGPLPPPLGVARALGGSPDRRRTSSQVERAAATPIPGRDRWEREAGRRRDGERSAAPARFRCPARERPAGTPGRSAPPAPHHAGSTPADSGSAPPRPRPTPPGARRTPPRAQPTPPPARSAPLPAQGTASRVPQPLGRDRLRADRGRHLAGAAGPAAAARLPDAPGRRVARAGPRPARGRVAPRPERTDRTRGRRGRGRTSQQAPPEHGRRDPAAERPRLGAGPRTAWPAAWTCWSPPH
jgi:hypothetical protein